MERRRGPIVDGVSRLLSTLAIVIGLGGSFFLYNENQTLKDQIEQLNGTADGSTASTLFEDAKEFNERWDAQLKKGLADYDAKVNAAIDRSDSDRAARNTDYQTVVDQLYKDRIDLEETSERMKEIQSFVFAPKLSLAENRMMLGDGGNANYVVIANEGRAPAEIQTVTFKPRRNGQFETTSAETKAAADQISNADSVVIQFSKEHNQATKLGHHRNYQRTFLTSDNFVPGGGQVDLSVRIENSDHVGWGWEGAMEIEYSNGRSLVIPSIRAVFVPSRVDTI